MKRRDFLQVLPAGLILASNPLLAVPENRDGTIKRLTILHTNDWHSRIEPFPMDGSRNEGLGGAAKRAELIRKIRLESDQVLLLDSGDIFQGTPYFNYFGGELEFKLMSSMGYDAATIGNHDFDGGIENLAHQLKHASFKMLNANYDLEATPLKDQVQPYRIIKKDGIKIGIFGIGIELDGLVPDKLYGNARYLDPIQESNKIADFLRKTEDCDLVICLSHLGYKYNNSKISDVLLAQKSSNIDVILGGHTHTFMKEPDQVMNKEGKTVLINQVGWAGILLGRIDFQFERVTGLKKSITSRYKLG